MKLLVFVDVHGNLSALKRLKKKVSKDKPDILVCAGDLSVFEQNLDDLMQRVGEMGRPVYIIQGNHESAGIMEQSCSMFKNIHFAHGKTFEKEGVMFIGWGGGGFSLRDKDLEKKLKSFEKKMKHRGKVVFFTHAPPYNTKVDVVDKEHVGNKTIRSFIKKHTKKIKLAVCGHLHEDAGKKDMIGETIVVNPGPEGRIFNI